MKRVIVNTLWVSLGVAFMSFVIATIRVIQEHYVPTYSGFGPFQSYNEVPFAFVIGLGVALCIMTISYILKWHKTSNNKQMLFLGFICGLVSISTVMQHCCISVVGGIPHFQIVIIFLVFLVGMVYSKNDFKENA